MRSGLALAATLVAGVALATPAPRLVDYLYVEANEGGSSGGHVAIRFGDETYHFQHEPSGMLRLRRDESEDFRYRYGVLGNRTTHVSRVAVSDAEYARLRWQLAERFFGERAIFAERDALHDDQTLLGVLLARRRGDATRTVALRAAGFFFPAGEAEPASPVVRALRERIEATYGPEPLRRRADELRETLGHLTPSPDPVALPPDGYSRFARPFSAAYRDGLTELAVLDVLEHARPLRADARRTLTDDDPSLDDAERRALGRIADRLGDALVRLLGSTRPDRGFALLVGMARLEALRESERTGRLVVLDAFPPDADVVRSPHLRHADALRGLLAEARTELASARARVRGPGDVGEEALAALEAAANRVLELEAATRGSALRLSADPLLPSREAEWSELVVPDVADADLARAVTRAGAVERGYEAELQGRYGYDLLTRNCVSELLATVERAGVDLGGRVDGRWPLDIVPFASMAAVDGAWHVVERSTWPSHRRARLDEIYRHEDHALAWLRESNVVTSTIYRRNDDDSFFLFFTDDVVAPRPLFGAANVAAGLGAGVVGLALLPFDGGHTALAGLRGVVFSLPELVFVNLRKGSFDYVPPEERPADAPDQVATAAHLDP